MVILFIIFLVIYLICFCWSIETIVENKKKIDRKKQEIIKYSSLYGPDSYPVEVSTEMLKDYKRDFHWCISDSIFLFLSCIILIFTIIVW